MCGKPQLRSRGFSGHFASGALTDCRSQSSAKIPQKASQVRKLHLALRGPGLNLPAEAICLGPSSTELSRDCQALLGLSSGQHIYLSRKGQDTTRQSESHPKLFTQEAVRLRRVSLVGLVAGFFEDSQNTVQLADELRPACAGIFDFNP